MAIFGQHHQITVVSLHHINIPFQAVRSLETDIISAITESCIPSCATEYSFMSRDLFIAKGLHKNILFQFAKLRINIESAKKSFRQVGNKKSRTDVLLTFDFGSGGRIRTDDLRVMSPTSYHCSTPHSLKLKFENLKLKILSSLFSKSGAKVRTFPEMTKFFLFFICYCLIICLLKIPASVFTRRV